MAELTRADSLDGGNAVRLARSDGCDARFHAMWLRDNALDEFTLDPANGQCPISLADIPRDVAVESAVVTNDTCTISFTGGHKVYGNDLATLQTNATASGSLESVVHLFGHIRETNCRRWFEVRSEVNPNNLAYTNLGLQAYTDNPYRDPVPGLQILACLENTVEGGESAVVDGFAAAEAPRREDPEALEVLAAHSAAFKYAGSSGVRLTAERPIIERGPDGEVPTIGFNNRSMAAVTGVLFAAMEQWYAA